MAYNMNEDDDDWDSDDLEDDEDEDDEYDEDPELDDDEEDRPRPNRYVNPNERAAKEDAARSRRLIWSGMKIGLSFLLLGGAAVYLFMPSGGDGFKKTVSEKLAPLTPYVEKARETVKTTVGRFSGKKETEKPAPASKPMLGRRPSDADKRPDPVRPSSEPVRPAVQKQAAQETAPKLSAGTAPSAEPALRVRPLGRQFNLSGAGDLPDLQTAIKENPSLKEALLKDKSVYTLERLWQIRLFVRDFIFQWAGVDNKKAVEAKVRMPYEMFERRVLSELLPFTTFRAVGLTPSYDANYIREPPVEAIGKFYQALSPVLANQTTEQGLETLRPVVKFVQYRCGRDKECTETLERMIQMLGYDDKLDELLK